MYGTCIGRFDGRRSFLVMNYRSRLEVYENHVVLLDPDQESEVVNYKARPVLASVLHSKGKRHAHAIIVVPADPSKRAEKDDASSSKTSKDSLVLYVDHSKGKHYWSLLRWDDEGSARGGRACGGRGSRARKGGGRLRRAGFLSSSNEARGGVPRAPGRLRHLLQGLVGRQGVQVRGGGARDRLGRRTVASAAAAPMLPPRRAPESWRGGFEVPGDFSAGRLSVALLVTTHDPPTDRPTCARWLSPFLAGTWGGTLGESGSTQSLEAGPFTCENLDPTTAVLCACDTENGPEVVAVSSQGMDRFWEDEVGGEFRSHRKEAAMGGVPTCARYVRELGILLVGETSGKHRIERAEGPWRHGGQVHRSGLAFPPPPAGAEPRPHPRRT